MLNPALPKIVKDGGRVAVITFHSGEDRIAKNALRDVAKSGALTLINKKVIVPTREEIHENPRARSAKLRAAVMRSGVESENGKTGTDKGTAALTSGKYFSLTTNH